MVRFQLPQNQKIMDGPAVLLKTNSDKTGALFAFIGAPPDVVRNLRVTVVVPLQAIAWFKVTLPVKSISRAYRARKADARLREILGGMLEDEVLDDVSNLHFSLQPNPLEKVAAWVSVCDRQWITLAIQELKKAGMIVGRIIPEIAPQSLENSLYVHGDTANPLVTHLAADGAAVLTVPLKMTSREGYLEQQGICVTSEPQCAAAAESSFGRCDLLQTHDQRLTAAMATEWDFAQFDIAQKDENLGHRLLSVVKSVLFGTQWRMFRIAAASLCAVNILGLNAWAIHDRNLAASKVQLINAALKETVPEGTVVIDAPVQMERAVKKLAAETGGLADHDLEAMLQKFTDAVGKSSVQAIDYSPGNLTVQAGAIENPGAAKAALEKSRIVVTVAGNKWMLSTGGSK